MNNMISVSIEHFSFFTFKIIGLWVSNGTYLHYSQSVLVTIFCPMQYDWYPLDSQVYIFRQVLQNYLRRYNFDLILNSIFI